MKEIRSYIRHVLKEANDSHRCLSGKLVPIESVECYDDVCVRIEDAVETRNTYPLQSDSRSHYNGLLKVLRRKKRKAKKFMESDR
tara:strand:- start:262 stop:516 length:255 start_codon:yes stop_codon:yes gene_type:complete